MKGTGNVTFFSSSVDSVSFEEVDFEYQPGDRSISLGVGGNLSMLSHAGTISFNLEPFEKWQSIYYMTFSFPNGRDSDHVFEVTRNFKQPSSDNGWLHYPVKPKKARLMPD
ncbi:hypothetical protein [Pseudomonas fulva]|uniref:hypothetical protein n=1 Tax=Pseudomonas fulva TaxID=47880 RepID=UPI003F8EF53A